MERLERRLIDRIADASVLLPTLLGAPGVVCEYGRLDSGTWRAFAICGGITGVLHVWFRAEDRWRHRQRPRETRLRRLRTVFH